MSLSDTEQTPSDLPMMFALAAHDPLRATGRLFLAVPSAERLARHGESRVHDITAELSLLHSRDMLARASWESGLNAAIKPAAGTQEPPLLVSRTTLAQGIGGSKTYRLRFVSPSEYEVWAGRTKLGVGILDRPYDADEVVLLVSAADPDTLPGAGAEYDLLVSPIDDVVERARYALRLKIQSDVMTEDDARTVDLEFTDEVPHRAAAFLRQLVAAYVEQRSRMPRQSLSSTRSLLPRTTAPVDTTVKIAPATAFDAEVSGTGPIGAPMAPGPWGAAPFDLRAAPFEMRSARPLDFGGGSAAFELESATAPFQASRAPRVTHDFDDDDIVLPKRGARTFQLCLAALAISMVAAVITRADRLAAKLAPTEDAPTVQAPAQPEQQVEPGATAAQPTTPDVQAGAAPAPDAPTTNTPAPPAATAPAATAPAATAPATNAPVLAPVHVDSTATADAGQIEDESDEESTPRAGRRAARARRTRRAARSSEEPQRSLVYEPPPSAPVEMPRQTDPYLPTNPY